jgi:hypothetical protein
MRKAALKLHWFFSSQLGIDFHKLQRSIRGVGSFLKDWYAFRKTFDGAMNLWPCLHDRYEEGGVTKSEYFWQDLVVARWIYDASPVKHVDVGSRVDGFVAHVASFREIEVFDVRTIDTIVPGIIFRQADLMDAQQLAVFTAGDGYCDSLSCLHALEHFGLGRYGDPVDVNGYKKGFMNLIKLLKPEGTFYLAVPIGKMRVEFNANWVFDPRVLIDLARSCEMSLVRMATIGSEVVGLQMHEPSDALFSKLATSEYNLGIFVFKKLSKSTSTDALK